MDKDSDRMGVLFPPGVLLCLRSQGRKTSEKGTECSPFPCVFLLCLRIPLKIIRNTWNLYFYWFYIFLYLLSFYTVIYFSSFISFWYLTHSCIFLLNSSAVGMFLYLLLIYKIYLFIFYFKCIINLDIWKTILIKW